MTYIVVGLGNPGKEYAATRHNTGRMLAEWFGKSQGVEWKADKKLNAQVSKVKVGKTPATLVLPDTFMNNSGKSVKPLITSIKSAEKLIVIYDDLDLPFGKAKISFNKSSGGHKGVESIIKYIKTEKFARIRVGISPTTPTGKQPPKASSGRMTMKKPSGETAVTKVILGKFKPEELTALKKLSKKVNLALETFISSGLERARQGFN